MGGGGLRILPHKKWHVWRRDNIERVLRDEREHEEQQQDLDAKERRLTQERRAQQLLSAERRDDQQQMHINFFQAEKAQACSKDAAKHRKNKGNGTDDTLRRHGKLPWYAQTEDATKTEPTVRQERKRKRELEVADPLQHMRPKEERGQHSLFAARRSEKEGRHRSRYIYAGEEGPAGSDRRKYSARYDRSSTFPEHGDRRRHSRHSRHEEDEEDKRSKKRGKHHKEKSKHKLSKKEALLQDLSREREEREASERRRAERLMSG